MAINFAALFEDADGAMTKEEAVYAILKISVMINGHEDDRERALLESLIKGSKTLRGSKDGAQSAIQSIEQRLAGADSTETLNQLAKDACASLEHIGLEICKSIFTQSVDIMLADGSLHPKEKALIQILAEQMKIPEDFVRMVLSVMASKNQY